MGLLEDRRAQHKARETSRNWGLALSGRSSIVAPMYGDRQAGREQSAITVEPPDGRHLVVDIASQTWDGRLDLGGTVVRDEGWSSQSPVTGASDEAVAPTTSTYDLHVDLDTDEVDGVTVSVEVDGTEVGSTTLDLHGRLMFDSPVGTVGRGQALTVLTDKPVAVSGGLVGVQTIEPSVGRAQDAPFSEPDSFVGATSDADTIVDGAPATVSLSPHADTAEGDIVVISVVASSVATGDYGTFTPDGTPTELHRFPFDDTFDNGVEAAVYWWRSDGTIPTFTYEVSGTGAQSITVMMVTYKAGHFPSSGDPFVAVEDDWGTSGTSTRSTRTAADPGADWTLGVGMGLRHSLTTGTGADYEQLWASLAHNISSAYQGSTAGTFVNSPDDGTRRGGFHTHGTGDAGVSAEFGQEYTHQYVVAAGVGSS